MYSVICLGNLHKWAYAPRGCAVLWVNPDFHSVIHPVMTSNFDRQVLKHNFEYQGTADLTAFYSAAKALQFYRKIGGLVG